MARAGAFAAEAGEVFLGLAVVGVLLLLLAGGGGGGGFGFLVAFFLQAGYERLNDVDLERGGEVGDASRGDDHGLQLSDEVCAPGGCCVLLAAFCEGYAQGQGGGGDVVAGDELQAVDLVCADGEAADLGFGAEAVDFDDEVHGGLGVGVEEGVGGDGGVPV